MEKFSKDKVNLKCGWDEYFYQLKLCDQYWKEYTKDAEAPYSVLGRTSSWLSSIPDGNAIIRYKTWDNLSYKERDILLGLTDEYGMHGLLGSMTSAGTIKGIFTTANDRNLQFRRYILCALQETLYAKNPNEYKKIVRTSLEKIRSIKGLGIGVASRLLALARPDMAISVNGKSKEGLSRFSGLAKTTLYRVPNYIKLLEWLYGFDWYCSPVPSDPWERSIWEKRAALIDAFVYSSE